jgi:UDP-N-acetylbacillosamine N-acetyltransferase
MTHTRTQGLVLFGCGGHARAVADVAKSIGIAQMVFIDPNAQTDEQLFGGPVFEGWDRPLKPGWQVFSAAGGNADRLKHLLNFRQSGWEIATLVAPNASIGTGATIGQGSLVCSLAHLGPLAKIGEGCIINSGAIVEHESTIGNYSHVSVHATIAGRSHIGRNVMVGAGATVIDRLSICDDVIVGAGATVIDSITEPGVYVGVPARRVK